MSRFNWALAMLVGALPAPLPVQADIPAHYHAVAKRYDIPVDILYSIALTESGWTVHDVYRPWPWTLNIGGKAHRYTHRYRAVHALLAAVGEGINVDVGLMQISSRWHAGRVERIEDLLDPFINLDQGAEILHEQCLKSRDWWEAVGRYHSPGNSAQAQERAQAYRQRVYKRYLSIQGDNYVKH